MIFPSRSQLASQADHADGASGGCHQGRPGRNPAPSTSARSNGTTSFSTASMSSIAPGFVSNRVLMLYFYSNLVGTPQRAKSQYYTSDLSLPARTIARCPLPPHVYGAGRTLLVLLAVLSAVLRFVFADRAALEALYNATDGGNWTENANWLAAFRMARRQHGFGVVRCHDKSMMAAIGCRPTASSPRCRWCR